MLSDVLSLQTGRVRNNYKQWLNSRALTMNRTITVSSFVRFIRRHRPSVHLQNTFHFNQIYSNRSHTSNQFKKLVIYIFLLSVLFRLCGVISFLVFSLGMGICELSFQSFYILRFRLCHTLLYYSILAISLSPCFGSHAHKFYIETNLSIHSVRFIVTLSVRVEMFQNASKRVAARHLFEQ